VRKKRKYILNDYKGWNYIKVLLSKAHSSFRYEYIDNDILKRKMFVALLFDGYNILDTIFISLGGSPPKAYLIMQLNHADQINEENYLNKLFKPIGLLLCNSDMSKCKRITPSDDEEIYQRIGELTIKELMERKDAVIGTVKENTVKKEHG